MGTVKHMFRLTTKLIDILSKGIEKLTDIGYKLIEESKDDSTGTFTKRYQTENGDEFTCHFKPMSDTGDKWDIEIDCGKFGKKSIKNISNLDIQNKVSETVENLMKSKVAESNHLNVTLVKVISNKDVSIKLTAINANYDIDEALNDLQSVVSDDMFVDSVTTEPTSYDITPTDDGYDVECVSTFNLSEALTNFMKAALSQYCNMVYLKWLAKGPEFSQLQNVAQDIIWRIDNDIRLYEELCYTNHMPILNPIDLLQGVTNQVDIYPMNFNTSDWCHAVQSTLLKYTTLLDAYYVNFSNDIQYQISDSLSYYRRECEYIMNKMIG